MLSGLRLRLTLLYLLISMLLVSLVGISTYSLLTYFFQNTNDAALNFKMALIFRTSGELPPAELQNAEAEWMAQNQQRFLQFTGHNEADELEEEHALNEYEHYLEEAYEGELSTIFVMPLNREGELLFNPNPYPLLMEPDLDAVGDTLKDGYDIRSSRMSDDTPVRLLTYQFPEGSAYEVIQLGKTTADQFRVLNQFLGGLLVIGALFIILLGFASWWMAGNSLQTTQKAWDNQQKFIANASHELRTPLTLIRASAEVALRHTSTESEPAALMRDVIQESDHMTGLVEDMLLLTRLDTQELQIALAEFSLEGMLKDIEHQFAPIMEERGLNWQVQPLQTYIYANEVRLRQVIMILLDNAMRHTPANGNITITAQTVGKGIALIISDSGAGIPQEALPKIFERFYQVQDARGVHGSSGLGLSIAKSLIEAQYGSIHIESEVGHGTTVHIQLMKAKHDM
ncbi:MAG: HAMP domain-containing histidine kinase [Anaerolineaceae bacterium]|nr:HAMP domain-containing histidine kinase [Anaerolineaceae bacterium]